MQREPNVKKSINIIPYLSRLKENSISAFHEGKQGLIKFNNHFQEKHRREIVTR